MLFRLQVIELARLAHFLLPAHITSSSYPPALCIGTAVVGSSRRGRTVHGGGDSCTATTIAVPVVVELLLLLI